MKKNNLLFSSLFNKDIEAPGSNDFLTALTNEHPYFSLAQFFLLQQTPKASDKFQKLLPKTALLFNNNYWLNFLLQETGQENTKPEEEITTTTTAAIPQEEANNIQYETDTLTVVTPEPVEEEERVNEPAPEINSITEEITTVAEIVPATVITEEARKEIEEDQINEPGNEINISTEESAVVVETTPATPIIEEVLEEDQTEFIPEDADSTEPKLTVNLSMSDTKEDSFNFAPLHTTDYFASVGIKLSEEVKPSDKLGQQLKSFTDWLKTMKKIHPEEQQEADTGQSESAISKLAEISNTNGDVVTEAMAEVLLQQGRKDKAIEMLEKLSLLNPGKSAYFAAKIKKLNEL